MSVHIDPNPVQETDDTRQFTTLLPRGSVKSLVIIAVAAAVALMLNAGLPFDEKANRGLAILVFIGILWLTEAVHITITALMVPILSTFAFGGYTNADGKAIMDTAKALSSFANPIIFVFFGGFALATALHIQKIDRKIAYGLIALSGGNMKTAVLLLFGATALLSMWISNTATAAMMLPLAIGLMDNLDREKYQKTFAFVLLGIAYSASIGGLGAIVGSPPNGIAAKALGLDFLGWMKYGLPMMLAMLPLMIFSLYIVLRPDFSGFKASEIKHEPIPWTPNRILTLVVFAVTALCWIAGKPLSSHFGFKEPDAVIAICAAIAVVTLGLASWKNVADNTDWGVLMLFGGGLALSALLGKDVSGASGVLGNLMADTFGAMHPFILILAVAAFIIFLTEFTSNTASAALLVPVFVAVSEGIGMPKEVLVMVIGIGASCAFMLPVATPPNAIVFGTGLIKQRDMMGVGMVLNVLCIILVAAWAYIFLM